jgi:predicted secreted protein
MGLIKRRKTVFKPKLYATVVLLGLLALIGTACVQEAPTPTPPPEAEANFRFLISDDANAIDDFEHLYVTISNIGFQGGESGNWTEFAPNVTEVDLKPLVEDNALEIWSGDFTPGDYNKVFVDVSDVEGILKGTSANETDNETAKVKLPGGKLQISKPFTVSEDGVTSFVYDITVVEAGQSGQYILKPQIAESGADKEFKEVKQEQEREREEEQEREQEQENKEEESEFEGTIETIDGTMWTVLINGDNWTANVSGAQIEGEPDIGRLVEIKGTEEDSVILASEVDIKEAEEPEENEDTDEGEGKGGAGLGISCNEFAEKQHIEEDIEVNAGEEFQITLCSNQSTGFQWSEAQIDDESVAEEVSHEFVSPSGQVVGAAGKEVWTFKALKEGKATIAMEYSQPWEGGTKAEWTFESTVEVK